MRILFVTHNVPRFPGDLAGSFVLRLAVGLQQRGARVEVIAPGATDLPARDSIDGVTIYRVPYASDSAMTLAYTGTMVEQVRKSWGARLALLGMLRAMRRATQAHLRQALAGGDPFEVVHTHWWFPAGLALLRSWPKGEHQPVRVLTMHGSDVRLARTIAPARRLMALVCGEYDALTAVSSWLAETASRTLSQVIVAVSPMPVNTTAFALPGKQQRSGLLFVGRLNAQKGIADLLNALARPALREALGNATLHIVGEGPDRETCLAQASRLGVADRLQWHGVLNPEELSRLYQRAVAVVMPSREEGLGLVAVEAQLCGTAVVAYASGGVGDVVKPEMGGTLVPAGDVEALANAVATLLLHPDEAARRGRLARDFVASRFSAEAVAEEYLRIYQTAQGASGGAARSQSRQPPGT